MTHTVKQLILSLCIMTLLAGCTSTEGVYGSPFIVSSQKHKKQDNNTDAD